MEGGEEVGATPTSTADYSETNYKPPLPPSPPPETRMSTLI